MNKNLFNTKIQQHILGIKREKKVVYRYLDEPQYADEFAAGEFRMSTLVTCRNHENQEQGDTEEAKETYKISYMDEKDPNLYKKAKQAGIYISNVDKIKIIDSGGIRTLSDGFLLCTTKRRDDKKFCKDFGSYCVKINDADLFFQLVLQELSNKHMITFGDHKNVIYRSQSYADDDLPSGKIGFVKREKYSWQEEYRFLWPNFSSQSINPTNLIIPKLAGICERVL